MHFSFGGYDSLGNYCLTSNMAKGWHGSSWDLSQNLLQYTQFQTLHHLVIIDLLHNPNWKLEDSGILNQKVARNFFSTHPTSD